MLLFVVIGFFAAFGALCMLWVLLGVWLLNPGSVSIPKDGSHSCLIYENGEFYFRILEE